MTCYLQVGKRERFNAFLGAANSLCQTELLYQINVIEIEKIYRKKGDQMARKYTVLIIFLIIFLLGVLFVLIKMNKISNKKEYMELQPMEVTLSPYDYFEEKFKITLPSTSTFLNYSFFKSGDGTLRLIAKIALDDDDFNYILKDFLEKFFRELTDDDLDFARYRFSTKFDIEITEDTVLPGFSSDVCWWDIDMDIDYIVFNGRSFRSGEAIRTLTNHAVITKVEIGRAHV